jgi:small conductance mechanosensitive channel
VGQYIDVLGVHGVVTEITIFTTTLLHADMSSVVIPNRKIVGEILHNYGTRRQIDLRVGVGYGTDLKKALAIVNETLDAESRLLRDPAPFVGIDDLGDSAIFITIRPWVSVPDYDRTRVELILALVEAFRVKGVELPFPQREIRIIGPAPVPALPQ